MTTLQVYGKDKYTVKKAVEFESSERKNKEEDSRGEMIEKEEGYTACSFVVIVGVFIGFIMLKAFYARRKRI